MTVLDVSLFRHHHLPASIRSVRRILPMAGCALPAALLQNPVVAAWVRTHKVAVIACGDDELDLVRASGVRPVQVVLRCCPRTHTIGRAAAFGVVRYVASTNRHVDALTCCTAAAKHVYLAGQDPAVVWHRCLDVVGMHCDVDDSRGAHEWGVAAERLLGQMASMRERRLELTRISLTGGSAATWLAGGGTELTAIATAIDEALDEGCARWRLPRPAVTLAPSAA